MRTIIGYKKRSYVLHILIVFCLSLFLPLTLVYLRVNQSELADGMTFLIISIYLVGVSILLYAIYKITTPIPAIEIEHDMLFIHVDDAIKSIPLSDVKMVEPVDTIDNTKHAKLLIQTIDNTYTTDMCKNYPVVCDEIIKLAIKYQRID